jgi:mono/diheme cytochrome c family protein
MRKLFTSIAVSAVVLLPVSGYGQMGMMRDGHMDLRPMQDCGQMNMSMKRHRFAMMNGIDERYTNKNNPLSPDSQIIASGEKLYEQNCASCHGATGLGNGEAGRSLNPRPSNIAVFSKMPMATDGYLYWTIAKGGVPLGTAMPPFDGVLRETEIWEIITYLRKL